MGSTRPDTLADWHNSSGMRRCSIESLQFQIDASQPILTSFNKYDIYNLSKRNGLQNYDIDFINGKYDLVPQYASLTSGGSKYVPHGMNAWHLSQMTSKSITTGSICMLKWGQDIPLKDLAASCSGLNSTLNISGTASCAGESSQTFQLYIVHLFERELVIGDDSMCAFRNDLISQTDVLNGYKTFQNKIDSSSLYLNSHSLRGGGFFSSLVSKISTVLPKILPAIRSGMQWYDQNKDNISSAVDSAKNVYNAVTQQAPVTQQAGGSKRLEALLANKYK